MRTLSNARVLADLQAFRLALALTGGELAAVPSLMKPFEHPRPRVSEDATVRREPSSSNRTVNANLHRTERP